MKLRVILYLAAGAMLARLLLTSEDVQHDVLSAVRLIIHYSAGI